MLTLYENDSHHFEKYANTFTVFFAFNIYILPYFKNNIVNVLFNNFLIYHDQLFNNQNNATISSLIKLYNTQTHHTTHSYNLYFCLVHNVGHQWFVVTITNYLSPIHAFKTFSYSYMYLLKKTHHICTHASRLRVSYFAN